jgi:3-hydroxy-9,10-secoandrosta-1,3,5(10)-triene-9,17-dione monooxygenase reductase component
MIKPKTFEEREFRDALGFFATGIAVVTARVAGVNIAATVSSFNAVSLAPPLVLFSIARKAFSFVAWQNVETFAVMVLTEKQADVSNRFSRSGSDKWQDVDPALGSVGAPMLSEWLACFECAVHARADGGDHEIIVGQVVNVGVRQPSAEPLIFYRGQYRALGAEGASAPRSPDLWLYGW